MLRVSQLLASVVGPYNTPSAIFCYFGFRFTAAYNSVLFAVVVHAASCVKLGSLMRGLSCGKLHSRPSQLLLARPTVIDPIARYWPRIEIFAYQPAFDVPVTGGPRRNIAITFGINKTRMVWLSDGEKN